MEKRIKLSNFVVTDHAALRARRRIPLCAKLTNTQVGRFIRPLIRQGKEIAYERRKPHVRLFSFLVKDPKQWKTYYAVFDLKVDGSYICCTVLDDQKEIDFNDQWIKLDEEV